MNFDLDINNYELKDLLYLFELREDFNEYDLKKAKKLVARLHPDKSDLDPEYFRFYLSAYNILVKILEFKDKNNKVIEDETYKKEIDEYTTFINSNNKATKEDIVISNKKFNEFFEKHNIVKDDGYGNWYKENINEEETIKNGVNWEEGILIKKQELKKLIPYTGNINEICAYSNKFLINQDEVQNYNSDLFCNLPYQDLKQAHTETMIPITDDDYNNIIKFKNVDEYKQYRDRVIMNKNNTIVDNKDNILEMYKMAKQYEETKK